MPSFETSIIIPVFNKWELTRSCLKSLARTIDKNRVEIIVIDNASSDVTPDACNFLGQKLFGESFKFIRNEQNRNFAGASNQGADAAQGNYLLFLNNDTEATTGWYDNLMQDFSDYPSLGATGSTLIYPDNGYFGPTIQHLGVLVSPGLQFGHLYQGIPLASNLAKKRRFYQAITGACLAINKNLFMETGKFDENYINGFEDVDFCGRLGAQGFNFTVNPDSVVIHRESQTPGRGRHDHENSLYLIKTNLKLFRPDWHIHLQNDNLVMTLTDWQHFQPRLPEPLEKELNQKLPFMSEEELKSTLLNNIYWENGWERLLVIIKDKTQNMEIFKIYFKLFRSLQNAARAVQLGNKFNEMDLLQIGLSSFKSHYDDPKNMLALAQSTKLWFENNNLPQLAMLYANWISNYANFRRTIYPEACNKYFNQLLANKLI